MIGSPWWGQAPKCARGAQAESLNGSEEEGASGSGDRRSAIKRVRVGFPGSGVCAVRDYEVTCRKAVPAKGA